MRITYYTAEAYDKLFDENEKLKERVKQLSDAHDRLFCKLEVIKKYAIKTDKVLFE